MSKSDPDSIIDPMEVIPEFGTDALRLALVAGTSAGNDQRVGKTKIVANRNFCNKLWNIARYIQETGVGQASETTPKTLQDHWILNKLSISAGVIEKAIENFRFSEGYDTLYHFVWDDLADWYIEASKTEPNREVLTRVLQDSLKLAHPFAPFVTETIWQELEFEGLLAAQEWPKPAEFERQKASDFEDLKSVISEARRIAAAVGVSKPVLFYQNSELMGQNLEIVKRLGRLGKVSSADTPHGMRLTGASIEAWLDIDQQTARAYADKLRSNQKEQEAAIKMLEGRLANKAYAANAPEELVEQTKHELKLAKENLEKIEQELIAVK